MAGIYLHIPFCKHKCYYCDFYSVAVLSKKENFLQALYTEIELQKNYLGNELIETIYFGGGTPSVLEKNELSSILNLLAKHYNLSNKLEITLEANPDDLNKAYLKDLNDVGVNRLSVGIQSFDDQDLQWMRRRHTAKQSVESIWNAKNAGFENLSLDLIYGLPNLTHERWEKNIDIFLQLEVPHLSAYHLTIEPNTVFGKFLRQGKLVEMDENASFKQFKLLVNKLLENGFEQYEISNFCANGFISKHNSSYWKQESYLGLGPSAHSFDQKSRQWNISNVFDYIEKIGQGKIPYEKEILTKKDSYNDYVLTRIRTSWGIDLDFVKNEFGEKFFKHCLQESKIYMNENCIEKSESKIILTDKGKFISNRISEDLLLI